MPDIGNSHVIEWYLHLAIRAVNMDMPHLGIVFALMGYVDDRFAPDDWTRYDGELL